jgi:ketosteroid isomerase-like protein
MLIVTMAVALAAESCGGSLARVRQQVMDTDAAYRRAWIGPDLKTMAQIMGDEWTVTHVNGRRQNKQQFLAAFAASRIHFLGTKLADLDVLDLGSVAVLTARAHNKIESGGTTSEGDVRLIAVYACRRGEWRVVSEQATEVRDEDAPRR